MHKLISAIVLVDICFSDSVSPAKIIGDKPTVNEDCKFVCSLNSRSVLIDKKEVFAYHVSLYIYKADTGWGGGMIWTVFGHAGQICPKVEAHVWAKMHQKVGVNDIGHQGA